MNRKARITRKTSETDITLNLNLDGSGEYDITSPVPFLNHMLELFAKHGLFDISLSASGDVAIDAHHTVEDIGICLGQAIKDALGKKEHIRRYGEAKVPMDEALAQITLDISNRPYLSCSLPRMTEKIGDFDSQLAEEFFHAIAVHAGITLHIRVLAGKNAHHILEAVFKAFARALDTATQYDDRVTGVPSTKGTL